MTPSKHPLLPPAVESGISANGHYPALREDRSGKCWASTFRKSYRLRRTRRTAHCGRHLPQVNHPLILPVDQAHYPIDRATRDTVEAAAAAFRNPDGILFDIRGVFRARNTCWHRQYLACVSRRSKTHARHSLSPSRPD